jgi:effector-binding domain-containing protein
MYALNHVPAIDLSKSTTGCCALIDPTEWDEKTFEFKDKLFAKARTRSIFHVPLNMSSVMSKAQTKIDEADARVDDFIILSYETSPWHADHYFAVSKEVPGLETERFTGSYMTKVFEGPFKDAQKWYKELIEYAKSKGKKPLNTYFFYTTCPNCSKVYGKNYVVGFEQVE